MKRRSQSTGWGVISSMKCKVRVKVQSDFGKIFIMTLEKRKNVQVDRVEELIIHVNEGRERRRGDETDRTPGLEKSEPGLAGKRLQRLGVAATQQPEFLSFTTSGISRMLPPRVRQMVRQGLRAMVPLSRVCRPHSRAPGEDEAQLTGQHSGSPTHPWPTWFRRLK